MRILSATEVEDSFQWATNFPLEASKLFHRALELRDELTRIFTDIAHGHVAVGDDVAVLEFECLRAAPFLRLQPAGEHFSWQWNQKREAVGRLIWEIGE